MRDFVFVHPTHSYDSYTDFRKLVSVSGFETCNQDQMDINRKVTYICSPLNGDVHAALDARPKDKRTCKVIWWFLERPGANGGAKFLETIRSHLNKVDEIWISDRAMWRTVSSNPCVHFVPTGGDEALGSREIRPKTFDVCHMSYVYGRREKIWVPLQRHLRVGPNGWGDARHDVLLRSHFLVNTHQDDDQFGEPLRFALGAAYGLPMLTETCSDAFPYEDGIDFLSAPFTNLVDLVEKACKEPNKFKVYGERMFVKATKTFRFRDIVKGMAAR